MQLRGLLRRKLDKKKRELERQKKNTISYLRTQNEIEKLKEKVKKEEARMRLIQERQRLEKRLMKAKRYTNNQSNWSRRAEKIVKAGRTGMKILDAIAPATKPQKRKKKKIKKRMKKKRDPLDLNWI